MPEDGPRKGGALQRFVSPAALYIPVALLYGGWSVYSAITTGSLVPNITVFCVPVHMMSSLWCYAAEPLSMIVLSGFMLLSIKRFGWLAGPVAAAAGVGYDLAGGGIYGLMQFPQAQWPATVTQVFILALPFVLAVGRLSLKPTLLMILYLGLISSGTIEIPIIMDGAFVYREPFIIGAFCVLWYRSLKYKEHVSEQSYLENLEVIGRHPNPICEHQGHDRPASPEHRSSRPDPSDGDHQDLQDRSERVSLPKEQPILPDAGNEVVQARAHEEDRKPAMPEPQRQQAYRHAADHQADGGDGEGEQGQGDGDLQVPIQEERVHPERKAGTA